MISRNHETSPPPTPAADPALLDPYIREACLTVGEVIEFWGFKKDMGMVWCFLYLRGTPATAAQVRDYFQISAGQTSTVLRGLVQWGVVRRITAMGREADLFVAETDLWRMISKVWRERELGVVRKARTALEEAHRGVQALRKNSGPDQQRELKSVERRLGQLTRLASDGERAVRTFLELSQLDFHSVVRFPKEKKEP